MFKTIGFEYKLECKSESERLSARLSASGRVSAKRARMQTHPGRLRMRSGYFERRLPRASWEMVPLTNLIRSYVGPWASHDPSLRGTSLRRGRTQFLHTGSRVLWARWWVLGPLEAIRCSTQSAPGVPLENRRAETLKFLGTLEIRTSRPHRTCDFRHGQRRIMPSNACAEGGDMVG